MTNVQDTSRTELCEWCRQMPADTGQDMDSCCSETCRLELAYDEGYVSDHDYFLYMSEEKGVKPDYT